MKPSTNAVAAAEAILKPLGFVRRKTDHPEEPEWEHEETKSRAWITHVSKGWNAKQMIGLAEKSDYFERLHLDSSYLGRPIKISPGNAPRAQQFVDDARERMFSSRKSEAKDRRDRLFVKKFFSERLPRMRPRMHMFDLEVTLKTRFGLVNVSIDDELKVNKITFGNQEVDEPVRPELTKLIFWLKDLA